MSRPLRLSALLATGLTLILLVAIPMGAPTGLQKGSHATYSLSASISFFQSCEAITANACPMIPTRLNVQGTLGWSANEVTNEAAQLNATRDVTISSDNGASLIHNRGSDNESVNLATRIVTFDRLPDPELASALSVATSSLAASLPAGTDLSGSLPTMNAMIRARPLYTGWWVNLPLKEKDEVPVLIFPTTVNGSTTVDLGSLGKHSAWTLVYNLTRPNPLASLSGTAMIRPIPVGFELSIIFTFNYDKNSGVLLDATAEVHASIFAPGPCSTPGTVCPLTNHPMFFNEFSYNLHASLKLSSTSLNLDGPPATGTSGGTTGSSDSGNGSGQGSGSNPSTDTQPTTSSGSNQGTNSGTTSGSSSTPSGSKPTTGGTLLTRLMPWGYWLLGIIGVAVVGIMGGLKLYKRTN